MTMIKKVLGFVAIGCLGWAAAGLFGWSFWRLIDAFGPVGYFALFGAIGLVAGVVWLAIVLCEGWRRRRTVFLQHQHQVDSDIASTRACMARGVRPKGKGFEL